MTFWDALTSGELDATDRGTPVVLPIGATEQHGPHLPLATDRLIADRLMTELDGRLGADVLILPTAAVGCSDHHMDFAGTLSAKHETLLRHIEDVFSSVLEHGFRNLLLFNSHGGNQGIAQVALERIGAAHRSALIHFTSWWRIAGPELLEISESGPGGVGHGCELETSMLLAVDPALVRTDRIPEQVPVPLGPFDGGDMLRAARATPYRRLQDLAATGVVGAPRLATAAKGRQALDAIGGQLDALLRRVP